MKATIFFNHQLNEKQDPQHPEPPLVIQYGAAPPYHRIYCHEVKIHGNSHVEASSIILKTGMRSSLSAAPDLHVRAWLECEFEDIEVIK